MAITGDLTLVVHDEDTDDQELDELTRQLQQELLLLDLPDVVRASVPGAAGGKSGLLESVGTLLVSGGFSVALLRSLTLVVRDWIKRGGARKAVLVSGERRLELTGASKKAQDAAVDAWIRSLAAEEPEAGGPAGGGPAGGGPAGG